MKKKGKAMKKKGKAMKKKDTGMGELLGLLKTRPQLVHALTFNQGRVKRLLKSKAARQLVPGVDPRGTLLKRVAKDGTQGVILRAYCLKLTRHILVSPVIYFNGW